MAETKNKKKKFAPPTYGSIEQTEVKIPQTELPTTEQKFTVVDDTGIKKKSEDTKVNPPAGSVETFTNSKTGRSSGVTLPDGRSFLGLSPEDVNLMAKQEAERVARPENSAPVGTAQNEALRQQRLQKLMAMQEQGILTEQELAAIQEAPIDWDQALTAGTLGNLPSVLTNVAAGIGGGVVAGSVVPGVGNVVGGAIGGVAGLVKSIWSGTQSNIKSQQKGEINSAVDVLNAAKTNMRQLRMVAEQDPTKAEAAIGLYYDQLRQVQIAYRKVQVETQGNLNNFMEDGTDILSDFELFLMPGGYADLQKMRLERAVARGTPATPEELLAILQEDTNED